jgi:7-keto-8-aminopelargonate synthetase-like enzyme
MAKIKHNNFLDTVDEVFSAAKRHGILHLYAEDDFFNGRKIKVNQKELYHFGTTGYLGLEQDKRLKKAAIEAILKYGTQFPLSKTYISNPLYKTLEAQLVQMYDKTPIIITKNSTLGHMGVIPSIVEDGDAIILDHQVHWSVQNAARILKTRSIPVEMIRHNHLQMLEDKVKTLASKYKRIWYCADGVYSMYGDVSPVKELLLLSTKYPALHLYFDDVHGMSWSGKNGTGFVMNQLKDLPEHVLVFGTLSKTFGASGAVLVCSNKKRYAKIKNFGGPLTFSAQLEPASVAAAIASATIHLSSEIYDLQTDLQERITYFNDLLAATDLPLIERNHSPVFYLGTGMPVTGYNFVNRLMNEGFFVNLGIFPAVPVKNTGVRITISRHNKKAEIKKLVEAMSFHYSKALKETSTSLAKVHRAFNLPEIKESLVTASPSSVVADYHTTILDIPKDEWNMLHGDHGVFDWDGLLFLEETFKGNKALEHNWKFHYFILRDLNQSPILATFFTYSLWKDDMLASEAVSKKIEERRKKDHYYLTSYVLSMGSSFTEGQHCYVDKTNGLWPLAWKELLKLVEALGSKLEAKIIVLRDFEFDKATNVLFHEQGFIKVTMPDSCVIKNFRWENSESYVQKLSRRSRKHFYKDIQPYEKCFTIKTVTHPDDRQLACFYKLYNNVAVRNTALNLFLLPQKIVKNMAAHANWEFLTLYLNPEVTDVHHMDPVGVMFCYKNKGKTYVPAFIGMDYHYANAFQIYRQLLFQTLKRAGDLGSQSIEFGISASFEKRKLGALVIPKIAYVQAADNFPMELIGTL